jgi:hypothetical protein
VRVGINAQKLFASRDFRNAGISRYIGGIVRRLPEQPGDERYVVYTNDQLRTLPEAEGPRLRVSPSLIPTTAPVARILWEQTVLPALTLRDRLDLLHCPLNVRPVISACPVVLTIHDLTFLKYPDRLSRLRQRYLAALTRFSARPARRNQAD